MGGRILVRAVGLALLITLAGAGGAVARGAESSGRAFQGVALLSGWSKGQLQNQDEYELVPVIVRFSYDLNVWLGRCDWRLPGEWRFNIEPFFGQSWSPATDQEYGCGFFLRWQQPVWGRLGVYLEGGVGPIYMTLDSEEQSTSFNFIDQVGAGVMFEVNDRLGAELGYRFRHVSNAGIKHPNGGIENDVVLLGLSYAY